MSSGSARPGRASQPGVRKNNKGRRGARRTARPAAEERASLEQESAPGDAGASGGSSDPGDPRSVWQTRLELLATIGPPTTVLAVLLIWYGYAATWQRYRYFGIYLELADLSNQDLILSGAEIVFPVAAVLLLAVLLVLLLHTGVARLVESGRHRLTAWLARGVGLAGLLLLGRALVGVLVPSVPQTEVAGVTPLSLTLSAPALAYAVWLRRRSRTSRPSDRTERALRFVAGAITLVGLFWTANSFAGGAGMARALEDARELVKRPEVVLYTRDAIFDMPASGYTDLGEGVVHRHRYRGLRLLLESSNRLFLVPLTWEPSDEQAAISTFVIPYDTRIRLQLLPQGR